MTKESPQAAAHTPAAAPQAPAAAPQAPAATPDNLVASLRRLHREYLASLRELAADGERRVSAALESCMSEMARIEDDTSSAIRKASGDWDTAMRASKEAPASSLYWDYQRRAAEATAGASTRADAARKAYLDAWTAETESLDELRRKARLDYLARVQQAWRATQVEQLDPRTAELLVQAFDAVFTDVAVG